MPNENIVDKNNRLNEHEEVQHILGKPPGPILHWGMFVLLFGVILLLALAAWLPLPETVNAPVKLKNLEPVSHIQMPVDGVISQLLVDDGEAVVAGQVLATLDNTASLTDVERLEQWLHQATVNKQLLVEPPQALQLGPLQHAFADLLLAWQNKMYWHTMDQTQDQLAQLQQQHQYLLSLQENIEAQTGFAQDEVAIAEKNYREYKQLKETGSASAVETDAAHIAFLRAQSQRDRLKAEEKNNQINIKLVETQLDLIAHEAQKDALKDEQLFRAQLKRTQSAIAQWRQQYLIRSPQAGRVVFTNAQLNAGYFDKGKELLAISPGAGNLMALGMLPQSRSGSLQIGMKVLLRFEAYPYDEYGEMEGQLKAIAPLANAQGQYRIEITLDSNLRTSTGKHIELKPELEATAWIHLKERSLLERLLDKWTVLSAKSNS